MSDGPARSRRRPVVLAWAVAVGLAAAPAAAVSARGPTDDARYTVLSLHATISSTQNAHVGPGQDGDGAADVELAALNRPHFTLPTTSKPRRVSVRVGGSGDANARFVLAARGSLAAQTVECASALRLGARAAPVTVQVVPGAGGQRMVRVRVTLPYVRAPYVEANDLYPPTGPCPLEERKLSLARTVPFRLLTRPRLVLTFGGKSTAASGDIEYTTSWAVALTLGR
jgi:hypothetical protein